MRRLYVLGLALFALVALSPASAEAQQIGSQSSHELTAQKMAAYTAAWIEIGRARDEFHQQTARTANKHHEAQDELRENFRHRIAEIVQKHGLTEEEYTRITFIISVDDAQRQAFATALERSGGNNLPQ